MNNNATREQQLSALNELAQQLEAAKAKKEEKLECYAKAEREFSEAFRAVRGLEKQFNQASLEFFSSKESRHD